MTSSREHEASSIISLTIPGFVEILNLMVGEMLAMLPSSKAPSVRILFLNQSTLPWMKYITSTGNWSNDEGASLGMNRSNGENHPKDI